MPERLYTFGQLLNSLQTFEYNRTESRAAALSLGINQTSRFEQTSNSYCDSVNQIPGVPSLRRLLNLPEAEELGVKHLSEVKDKLCRDLRLTAMIIRGLRIGGEALAASAIGAAEDVDTMPLPEVVLVLMKLLGLETAERFSADPAFRAKWNRVRPKLREYAEQLSPQDRITGFEEWVQTELARLPQLPRPDGCHPVVLGKTWKEPVVVRGKEKKFRTPSHYRVIAALAKAGKEGLKKDELEVACSAARKILREMREDHDWAAVIYLPGPRKDGYRLVSGTAG